MKVYKKAGIIFITSSIITLFIFLSLPFFFQDQLFDLLEGTGKKQLNAQLSFNKEKSSLSFLPNFPNLTATIKDLRLIGLDDFAADTLLELNTASVTFSTWQLIWSQEPQPRYITLNAPKIKLKRTKDGKENWNILREQKDDEEINPDSLQENTDNKDFQSNLVLKGWRIKNASFTFEDELSETFLEIKKLNHQTKGDFSESIFDLNLILDIGQISWTQNGTKYLDKHKINLNASLEINQEEEIYQLNQGTCSINQFQINSEGNLKIIEKQPHFDFQLSSPNQQFLSFLSVFFSENWTKNFQTEGEVSLTGFIKGVLDAETKQFPLSHLHFQIKDASFQYSKMPKKLKNMNLDVIWNNQQDKGSNFQLKNLEAKIDKSQIKGNLSWQKEQVQGRLGANIDLEELGSVFPLPGLSLKGKFQMNALAKGAWNEKNIPSLNVNAHLEDGFAKIILFPKALENIQLDLEITDSTNLYEDFDAQLKRFSFQVEQDSLLLVGNWHNYNQPSFAFTANGVLNFTNLTKVIPFLNQELLGRIYLDIQSQGKINEESFTNLQNQGEIRFENFKWKSPDFSQEIKIIDALILLQQRQAQIEELLFFYGKNDLTFKGQIIDYMDYLFFPKKGVLKLDLSCVSREFTFPLDTDPTFTDIGQFKVRLPKNYQGQISSNFEKLHFFQYDLEQVNGSFQLKEGVFSCSEFEFLKNEQSQKLQFSYDSKPEKPLLDYNFISQ